MKIGVLSDTHDQRDNIAAAVKILNKHKVALTVHCGDWVSPFTQRFYQDLKCPIRGIFGNNDGDKYYHTVFAKKMKHNIEFAGTTLSLTVSGRKIFVYHGEDDAITESLVRSNIYDAVFHGHTHIATNKTIGKTLSLNPGTLIAYTREQIQGVSCAVYDTSSNTAIIIRI
ncbi:hypothetical protein A2334_01475 [Candidatus Roizmanbacteria bacterium RIFOXYB2_FULL_38_10]|uniref:Phosphoesterase n=1 Tax=Candidatus Roizmanbacteria bacterium RIFOXYD1_FULL_38_12 TaxID=1802093 RepID=A0A1F7L261_9BACT|nr:MAG: hypothetical protein A3K47_05585 [Candidatus Roizmanbacteria bacterium RIFOXYA2_FULL_38_14]OGK64215.1 MAG: hypothetical protein A3K27_05585 [Candidatus Roizmanbacteria bacterium RIFOXYA1_FULL_37_12]OGK66061.1 MAG: hypothetical protein A3K38_05585 [Candidatus Roizmanbacteria bacterium RIFOXYB1_FULL_40_23]OGK68520.1 MAG: hypothetical protein A2334_01475 [Candidatus Roizmanbacteria bacterium RIFOXYB2_FULL_38_10]OGK70466.1 MAG: hypothetical protein A3K21_05590 [Candidatus Roizmanbacteria ba